MKLRSSRFAGALTAAWTVGCALLPVHIGNDVGMRTTSCGTAVSSLFGNALSQYGPGLGPICQDHAQERLVVWAGLLVPFIVGVALTRFRRSRASRALPLEVRSEPRWVDALTYASMFFAAPLAAVLVFFFAKDRVVRRNAARALELQLLPAVGFLWLFTVSSLGSDFGTPSVFVGATVLLAVAAVVGSIVGAVLALANPAALERWEPLIGPLAVVDG